MKMLFNVSTCFNAVVLLTVMGAWMSYLETFGPESVCHCFYCFCDLKMVFLEEIKISNLCLVFILWSVGDTQEKRQFNTSIFCGSCLFHIYNMGHKIILRIFNLNDTWEFLCGNDKGGKQLHCTITTCTRLIDMAKCRHEIVQTSLALNFIHSNLKIWNKITNLHQKQPSPFYAKLKYYHIKISTQDKYEQHFKSCQWTNILKMCTRYLMLLILLS